VEYEDQVTIATPEGVELRLALAGLGSRSVAGSVDLVLKVLLIGALALLLFGLSIGGGAATAVFSAAGFAIYFGYDVLFEVLAAGRTPGKRFSGLRVVAEGGAPVVLLISPPPVGRLTDLAEMFEGSEEKSERFAVHYGRFAEQNGCGFLDAGAVIASSDVDGIHLEEDEHRKLGEAVAPRIKGALR